ncbi:MAG: response regulator transcription factor [Chloroflexaceae bacterium]|nr:response regulator transcription factor [Chloroflexaceae bacterium]
MGAVLNDIDVHETTTTVLVVDDRANVRLLLEEFLVEQGFTVVTSGNGQDALELARRVRPDVILLDIMMPKMDGYTFLEAYRVDYQTPVIIITAKDEENDAVRGLDLGADDYIIKPFRMRELLSRIQAVLRRVQGKQQDRVLHIGEIVLNKNTHTVTVRGEPVTLTPTEFTLLELLMDAAGQTLPRDTLYERLLDQGYTGTARTISVHVRNLRMKVEADPEHPHYITTAFGVGYCFRKEPPCVSP